jgi:hypothetical protein
LVGGPIRYDQTHEDERENYRFCVTLAALAYKPQLEIESGLREVGYDGTNVLFLKDHLTACSGDDRALTGLGVGGLSSLCSRPPLRRRVNLFCRPYACARGSDRAAAAASSAVADSCLANSGSGRTLAPPWCGRRRRRRSRGWYGDVADTMAQTAARQGRVNAFAHPFARARAGRRQDGARAFGARRPAPIWR